MMKYCKKSQGKAKDVKKALVQSIADLKSPSWMPSKPLQS